MPNSPHTTEESLRERFDSIAEKYDETQIRQYQEDIFVFIKEEIALAVREVEDKLRKGINNLEISAIRGDDEEAIMIAALVQEIFEEQVKPTLLALLDNQLYEVSQLK